MGAEWLKHVHVAQGFPTPSTDAAVDSIFLVLFFCGALANITIFLRNKKRNHKFVFNGMCTGFCMARTITCALRLAWMYNLSNRGLAIAATIFTAAGVLILFVINLIFAQRILRGVHPHLGWHNLLSKTFLVTYILMPVLLAMTVTASTQIFFVTNPSIRKIDLNIQRAAATYFMFFSSLPIPITIFALLYPNKTSPPDHFGKKSVQVKSAVILVAATLLLLGSGFRTGTAYVTWNPEVYTTNPPWWNAKWCFYFFNFTVEYIVVIMFLVLRIDLLFHVRDGAKGPYSYSEQTAEKQVESGSGESQKASAETARSAGSVGSQTLRGSEEADRVEKIEV